VLRFLGIVLLVWIALSILGAVIDGLFWLALLGGALFLVTAAIGAATKRRRQLR
jgi:hypothetical protein